FIFTESESSRKLFINSIPYNGREHRDEILGYDAKELFEYLRSDDVFQIDERYSEGDARKIIAVRHQMYQLAYQKYKPIIIAKDISPETLSMISEHHEDYPGVFSEIEYYRHYTYGKAFGNVLGYTRAITSKQFEAMQELGYDKDDVVGQMGIEQTMEQELRGQKGKEIIAVDNVGRKVDIIESQEARQGNDVFLTVDTNIQLKAYEAIEKRLTEAMIQRLRGGLRNVQALNPREILISMIESNQLSLEEMKQAKAGTMQYELYQKLTTWFEQSIAIEQYTEKLEGLTLKEFLVLLLQQEKIIITDRELLLVLSEQGSLKLDESLVQRIWKGKYPSLREILIEELASGDLKPDQMAIDPFSASAVVIEVSTGNVLALVGYPSYDSNEMTNRFNTYYSMLQDGIDERNLLWNRALRTAKAPGSTFKMISALAGLEEGVVDTHTVIEDNGPYTKAGMPYPKCWFFTNNGYGHGPADVHRALEVSCNVYFYELAYRLGLKYGVPYGAIDIFSKYAQMFGLDAKTGIELDETPPNVSNPENMLKSNISKAFNVIRNVSDEGQKKLDMLAIDLFNKGIYPYANPKAKDFKGKLAYKLEKAIKKEVDQGLKDTSEEH
ncbi:MAG: penicillin-binding transpeptidase domain-containing protein, partial [Cellulosilyticaceae bacterium]